MANNVYIGMRYVPIFDGPWNSSKSYEALVIVEYGNNTYTSKKPVPVGIAPTNTTYWALTGNYNGQISALDTKIDNVKSAIETDVNEIKLANYLYNKKIVVYGDSTVNLGSGDTIPSYMKMVSDAVDATLTNRAVPGSNMNHTSGNNGVYLINRATDLLTYDFMFLCYGYSEWTNSFTEATIKDDVNALISAVRTKNANISIVFCLPYYAWRNGTPYGTNLNQRGRSIYQFNHFMETVLKELNVPFINLANLTSCNQYTYTKKLLNDSGGIYVHPNEEFRREIAGVVLNDSNIEHGRRKYSILNRVDFTSERYAVSFNEMSALTTFAQSSTGLYSGYALKIGANQTIASSHKLFNAIATYNVRGITDKPISIKLNNTTFNIPQGEFDFDANVGIGVGPIEITTTALTFINDFDVSVYSDNPTPTYDWFKGRKNVVNQIGNAITVLVAPYTHFTGEGVNLPSFAFRVDSPTSISSGANMFKFASGIDLGYQGFLVAHPYDGGSPLIMEINGNYIKAASVPNRSNIVYYVDAHDITPSAQSYSQN